MRDLGSLLVPNIEAGEPKGGSERGWCTTQPSGRVAHGFGAGTRFHRPVALFHRTVQGKLGGISILRRLYYCTFPSHVRSAKFVVDRPQDGLYHQEPANTQTKLFREQI